MPVFILRIIAVFFLGWMAAAQEVNPRHRVSLTGLWEITADEGDEGLDAKWFLPEAWGRLAWQPIFVPSAWETALGIEFDAVAWYKREVQIPEEARGRKTLLRFHGAATEARVWVNGREAGTHLGAWTPFTLDITEAIEPGKAASIVMRLDEKVGHNTQGFLPIIAPHFGGLWQKAELIIANPGRIDDLRIRIDASRVDGDGRATLNVEVPVLGPIPAGGCAQMAILHDGQAFAESVSAEIKDDFARLQWQGNILPWNAGEPNLYELQIQLLDSDRRVLDELTRYTGFRNVVAQGRQIVLNDKPLSVRGFLTWGCHPPLLAPMPGKTEFLKQLSYLHACGFNLIKFCLWLPPAEYLDMVDATGMLAWIEYPTWHPKLDAAHRAELLREYEEMTFLDHHHPSVILRSITCETGPSADLQVLRELYDLVKERAPGTLVEDDSSWIEWNRIHDFWDDHSYGNNRTWRDTLRSLDAYREEHGIKPLLLGEAIAADTWIDARAFPAAEAGSRPWWAPNWLDNQIEFENDLRRRFSGRGSDPIADLQRTALNYALEMRRWQIETFREQMPFAGYVVSVIQDVRLCAMGLLDSFGKPKWQKEMWEWHGEESASLMTPHDQRAFRATQPFSPTVKVREGVTDSPEEVKTMISPYPASLEKPAPCRAYWEKEGRRKPAWELWALPEPAPVPDGTVLYGDLPSPGAQSLFPDAERLAQGAAIARDTPAVVAFALSRPVLDYMEAGGRVLHFTSGLSGSFKTERLWFLRGTAWAPPEPGAFFRAVPRDMLSYLQLFELGGSSIIRGDLLFDHVDPLLLHLETHDMDRVRPNLLLFDTNLGQGRLMVSGLRHEGGPEKNYAGLWLARALLDYLVKGPKPDRSLCKEVLDALRSNLDTHVVLLDAPWRFKKDEENKGIEEGWFEPDRDDSAWEKLSARSTRESEIWNAYDGWGWYRNKITIPAGWEGKQIRWVSDSVDDMYELYVNGLKAGSHGSIDRASTSYLQRTWVDLTPFVKAGEPALLAIRIHDWVGGGGLNGEAFLTTGPVEKGLELLNR
ncbi:MAG: sugar-binding domain-containing protein [Planctomycetota bacterium]